MKSPYDSREWYARKQFVTLLEEVCAAQGLALTWLCSQWIARVQKNDTDVFISGYLFPLNTAPVSDCMRDKVATYEILTAAGVPGIPHHLVRLPSLRDTAQALEQIQAISALPVVIKPAAGESGGFDVYKCETEQQITDVVADLATRHRSLAVSPFVDITQEYRVVVLDGEPLLIFEKVRDGREWRHNLKLGATPQIVPDGAVKTEVQKIAVTALRAMQGRLGAVDIANTPEGYKVMEINGGIALDRFSMHTAENRAIAVGIYTEIMEKSLTSVTM